MYGILCRVDDEKGSVVDEAGCEVIGFRKEEGLVLSIGLVMV